MVLRLKQANARDAFFIGRGIDYAISMEGSYEDERSQLCTHELMLPGELKHGTISD